MLFAIFLTLSIASAREYDFRETHIDRAGNRFEHIREQKCREWQVKEAPVCRQNYQAEIQRTQANLADLQAQREVLVKESSKSMEKISGLRARVDGLTESLTLAENEIAWLERGPQKESEFWPGGLSLRDFPAMKGKLFHWRELDATSRKNQLKGSLEANKALREKINAEYLLFVDEFKPVENQLANLSSGIQQSQSAISNYQVESDRRCTQCPH